MLSQASRVFSSHTEKRMVTLLAKKMSTSEEAIDSTIQNLATDLQRLNIDYAIVGGNALKVHGFKRFTTDVDVLLAKGGKELFAQHLIGRGYSPRFEKAKSKFRNTVFNINIDLLESGDYPGDGKPKDVSFPSPEGHSFEVITPSGARVKYLQLSSIIELKLASYQSLPNGRERDKLDVVELIKITRLDESFATKLNPSIKTIFTECYHRAKREFEEESSD